MFMNLFNENPKKVKKLLYMHGVFFLVVLAVGIVLRYFGYMEGYDAAQEKSYFGIIFLLSIVSFFVLLTCFICYLVMLIKNGLQCFFFSIFLTFLLFLILCLICLLVPGGSPAKGYYDYVKTNVDISEIHRWLMNYKNPDYEFEDEDGTKRGRVIDVEWPECIKVLNPRDVLIGERDSKKYLRVCYNFGLDMSFGLCVMDVPMDVPEYGFEDRIELQNNAFIWVGN